MNDSINLVQIKKRALEGDIPSVLQYAYEISKTTDLCAIQEAVELLDNCEWGKRFSEKNPEVFYIKGKILYDFFSSDDADDAIRALEYAKELGYQPAATLIEEIERKEEEKCAQVEQQFINKMENLMKKAIFTDDEERFLEGQVDDTELEGCTCYPPKKWEEQFVTSDKFGVKYNHKYHRLISGEMSLFNPFRLKSGIDGKNVSHYEVQHGTQIICGGAFSMCRILSMSLPNTLKVIGSIPGMVSNLTIPQSVEEIYVEAFDPDSAIQTLKILNGNIRVIWEGYDGFGTPSVNDNNYTADDLLSRCRYIQRILIPKGFIARFTSLFPSVADRLEEFDPMSFDKLTQSIPPQGEKQSNLENERLEEMRRHNREMEMLEKQKLEILRQRQLSEDVAFQKQDDDDFIQVIIDYKLRTWRGDILDNCNMIRKISRSTYNSLLAGGRAAVISFVQGEKGFSNGDLVFDACMGIL